MNQKLQNILEIIQQSEKLDAEQKNDLVKAVKDADKELEITAFKLERTEKVKKTTAILLEETIEELEQKRKAVEEQNHELEIEAALERVRAVAMSMHKSDDLLSVSEKLFSELTALGFNDLRNSLINIFNDVEKFFQNYDYSDDLGGSISSVKYKSHPIVEEFVAQIRRASDAFVETVIDKNQLNDWKEFRRSHGEQDDQRLENIDALYYYTYSISHGSIGISNFKPISKEQLEILKRFRNVFDLAYRRYNDIAFAEAKAREAQIEASLERVRAVAMGMHNSEDLLNICEVSFKEFQKLGFDTLRNAIIHILNDEKRFFMDYDYSDYLGGGINKISYDSHPILEDYLKQIKKDDDAFAEVVIDGDQLDSWKDFRRRGGQQDDPKLENIQALYYYLYSIGVGDIGISTFKPIDESQIKILKRFRNVFDLAYRRYTDITQAEAQAREAQIQLALERVRARTMAMQRSDELAETAYVLYEQFGLLGENPEQLTIGIVDETNKIWEFWLTLGGNQVNHVFKAPIKEPIVLNKSYIAWKEKKRSLVIDISGDELKAYYNFFKSLPNYEEYNEYRNSQSTEQRRVIHYAFFSKGSLSLASPEPKPAETIQLLERFAGVLEQTYTRFLDLQKAETQAKEAQIEAALERVRSRSMAMHHTSELQDVINTVHKQFKSLDIAITGGAFIGINEENKNEIACWGAGGTADYVKRVQIPYYDSPIYTGLIKGIQKGPGFFTEVFSYEEKIEFFNHLFKNPPYSNASKERKEEVLSRKGGYTRSCAVSKHTNIFIINHHGRKFSEDENNILIRFGKVFEQSYTRFLDLQKAEAQAREAQIEAALERIRSRAMGMHSSDELLDVANILREQMGFLGQLGLDTTAVHLYEEDSEIFDTWYAIRIGEKGDIKTGKAQFRKDGAQLIKEMLEGYNSQESSYTLEASENKMMEFFQTLIKAAPEIEKFYKEDKNFKLPEKVYYHLTDFSGGSLVTVSYQPPSDETKMLQKRAASVFNLAYRRYLDLKKAEAQAREAQIEAALERVRSRTMGMQKSEELQEVIRLVYEQFINLNIHIEHTGFIVDYKARDNLHIWLADHNEIPSEITIPCFDSPPNNSIKEAKEKGQDFFTYLLTFEEKNKFYRDLFKYISGVPEKSLEYYFSCPGLAGSGVLLENVGLYIENFSGTPYTDEENKTLMRFGKVFQQTYTRFLDLQKAETQAREAQIETALERVRSLALGMRKSEEVGKVTDSFFAEFNKLTIKIIGCSIVVVDEKKNSMEIWRARSDVAVRPFSKTSLTQALKKMKEDTPEWYEGFHKTLGSKNGHLKEELSGEKRLRFLNSIAEQSSFSREEKAQFIKMIPAQVVLSFLFFKLGYLALIAEKELPQENLSIARRFADVFDFAYTRFLDLKKAEAQAREAQIEASLERVRSRAMSMHSSEDLSVTVNAFFKELKLLNVIPIRCGVGQIDGETRLVDLTVTTATEQGNDLKMVGKLKLAGHPVLDTIFEKWKHQQEYHPVLRGNEIKDYYQVMNPQIAYPDFSNDEVQYGYYFHFKEGGVFAWTEKKFSDNDLEIFRKFTTVLSLTFRRYLDLKVTEARAAEAVKQASLDRVRAEIASMRTAEDLNRITPIIWRELKTLEVPFIRCGVFIVNEEVEQTHVYLSTPDGKALGVLNLSFDANTLTSNTVEYWRKKDVYKEHWNKEEFISWTKSMMELGQVQNAETYQGSSTPPESLHLHFVPFTQGMLYVGDINPLSDEKLDLVKTLAEAFSIAYARYEDFKQLEEAKNKIELTLSELKSAQAQLVHSEKMASLGELTAGIAHEIKNPLNFVNNFSEISGELLDEVKVELEKNDKEEVLSILKDLKQNLEKINQHGKRADSIVKGMLLHSRGTAGEKVLTDINDLLDQYVNLAYHGMRATNKEFNITIEKDYNESIEKINVVPQDISRVFLNIINNACYAAYDKKKKSNDNEFSPTLKVSTKNLKDKVEIRIGDNGNGIPKDILDKIFQPFFTTKPTGEGTGLGLSLSYDIVTKMHKGELKAQTRDGEGTNFIILLPKNQ